MVSKPDGSLEALGQRLAGMTFLTEVSNEEARDTGVIVDNQELARIAGQELHWLL